MNIGQFKIKILESPGQTREVKPEEEQEIQRQFDLVSSACDCDPGEDGEY